MRTTVPIVGSSRAPSTSRPAIVLTAIGQSSRSVDVKPANSGGTAADEATGGASGSGASRTMLTTAPPTPTHVTGRHRASAAAHASGSTDGDGRRAEEGERHEGDGRRREVVGQRPSAWTGHGVGVVGVVDLLGERFDGVETEQVEGDADADERRRRAAEHGDRGDAAADRRARPCAPSRATG